MQWSLNSLISLHIPKPVPALGERLGLASLTKSVSDTLKSSLLGVGSGLQVSTVQNESLHHKEHDGVDERVMKKQQNRVSQAQLVTDRLTDKEKMRLGAFKKNKSSTVSSSISFSAPASCQRIDLT